VIITEAGIDDRVTELLCVTSVMPDAEQSQADLIGSKPAPWLTPSDDDTVGVDPDMIREFFLQDCDEVTTEQALSRLTRQSLARFTQPPRQIARREAGGAPGRPRSSVLSWTTSNSACAGGDREIAPTLGGGRAYADGHGRTASSDQRIYH
jgi:hypothetical protein